MSVDLVFSFSPESDPFKTPHLLEWPVSVPHGFCKSLFDCICNNRYPWVHFSETLMKWGQHLR